VFYIAVFFYANRFVHTLKLSTGQQLFCCVVFRCQSLLSSVCSKLDKENALRLQMMFASEVQTGSEMQTGSCASRN